MFDNTSPTRLGRCGFAYISPESGGNIKNKFRLALKKGIHKDSNEPVDKYCNCYVCNTYSRGYIKHLLNIKESTASRLLTYHNLHFMEQLGVSIRNSIENDDFVKLYNHWLG